MKIKNNKIKLQIMHRLNANKELKLILLLILNPI